MIGYLLESDSASSTRRADPRTASESAFESPAPSKSASTKAWAPEITVNSVAPGVISFEPPDARVQRMIDSTPAKRAGTPGEIASAVSYFLNASNFVTGQVLAVDGGLGQK